MNKLKKQKINNLLNYQHFLKNNSLKKKKPKLKNILFENQILYKNQDLNIIKLNNSENINIPITVVNLKNISSIQNQYENQLLFNYDLNYNILYNFNKIIFNYKKKNNNIVKGRVITGNKKKVLVSIFGFVFSMKSINLNTSINNKKIFYTKKTYKKKIKYKSGNFFYNLKKMRIKRIINTYKLRYLNFKIEKIKNKDCISRNSYLKDIIKYVQKTRINNLKKIMILEKKKKKKSNLSRKEYEKKNRKKI